MKKIILFALAGIILGACQKYPDTGELKADYAVYTTYNPAIFATPKDAGTKVFVDDKIIEIKQDGTAAAWNTGDAPDIIDMFIEQLTDCGYAVVRPGDDLTNVNMNLVLSYVRDVTYYYDYVDPYWWWDYWDGGYWPGWYYPYPYAYVFEYSIASLVAELIKPAALTINPGTGVYTAGDDSDFPVYWNAFIGGYDYGSKAGNAPFIEQGIPRAFAQSPYLQTAGNPT